MCSETCIREMIDGRTGLQVADDEGVRAQCVQCRRQEAGLESLAERIGCERGASGLELRRVFNAPSNELEDRPADFGPIRGLRPARILKPRLKVASDCWRDVDPGAPFSVGL